MSWGERSCVNFGSCELKPTIQTCNVCCDHYESNGRKPDSKKAGPAVYMAHWPNQDTPVCIKHRMEMEKLGAAIGLTVSFTPLLASSELYCINCVNESDN